MIGARKRLNSQLFQLLKSTYPEFAHYFEGAKWTQVPIETNNFLNDGKRVVYATHASHISAIATCFYGTWRIKCITW